MVFKDSPIIYSKIEINRIDDGLLNINCVELVSAWTWNFEKFSKIWFQNFKKFLSVELGQITLKIKKYKIIIKGTSLRRIFLDEILRWFITKIFTIASENLINNEIFGCPWSSNELYSQVYTCWAWEIQFGRRIEPF